MIIRNAFDLMALHASSRRTASCIYDIYFIRQQITNASLIRRQSHVVRMMIYACALATLLDGCSHPYRQRQQRTHTHTHTLGHL